MLLVIDKTQLDVWLFLKETICNDSSKSICDKILKDLFLKCPICTLFLRQILSATLMIEFFMLFLTFVANCTPSINSFSKRDFLVYSLSPKSYPLILFSSTLSFKGSQSSAEPAVNTKLKISPLSLIIRCNLEPKNHPMEHFPRLASPLRVLYIRLR